MRTNGQIDRQMKTVSDIMNKEVLHSGMGDNETVKTDSKRHSVAENINEYVSSIIRWSRGTFSHANVSRLQPSRGRWNFSLVTSSFEREVPAHVYMDLIGSKCGVMFLAIDCR